MSNIGIGIYINGISLSIEASTLYKYKQVIEYMDQASNIIQKNYKSIKSPFILNDESGI